MSPMLVDQNTIVRPVMSGPEESFQQSWVDVGPLLVVPGHLLQRYIAVAMRSVTPRKLEHERWYADIPGCPGVWGDGDSPKACLDALAEVLEDWLILKIADRDRDIPVIDEIDLNFLS